MPFSILFNCRLEADEHEVASFIYSLAFFLALMDNRCQKDSCSALGGFSVSCVIRNIPVSVDLLKVIQTKYGFDYGALRTGICGCAVIWSVFYCSEKYLSDSWQMSNDHAKLGFQGEKKLEKKIQSTCVLWYMSEYCKSMSRSLLTTRSQEKVAWYLFYIEPVQFFLRIVILF